MIVRRIVLRDFKRFQTFAADFAPGFNVIIGDNEEGKSTLREAITLGLFQDPKTSDKKILAQQRWGAKSQFAIELQLEADGKTYVLSKDFETKASRLEERDSGNPLLDARAIERRVGEMLGLRSRDVFESTVRVTQRDVTAIQHGPELADSLQRLLTGGEQDTHAAKVLGDLDRAVRGLTSTARGNPGPLHLLPAQIAELEQRAAEQRQRLDLVERAQCQLGEKTAERAAATAELALKEQLAQDCAERLRLAAELQKAEDAQAELEKKIARAEVLQNAVARAERELGEYSSVLALPPDKADQIRGLEQEVLKAGAPPAPPAQAPIARSAPGVAAILLGAALVLIGLLTAQLWLAAIGFAVGLWGWLQTRSTGREAQGIADEMRARAQREAAEAARRLDELLTTTGCRTATEFHERRRAAAELRDRQKVDGAALEGWLEGQTKDDVEQKRKAASKIAREIRDRLDEPALRLAAMDHANYRQLRLDVDALRVRDRQLQDEIGELSVTVRADRVNVDELYALDEQVQGLKERLAAAAERQEVLILTRRVLDEARAATMVSARDVLEGEFAKLVAEITGGRYGEVSVDEKLDIALRCSGRDEPVGVALAGALSTGTVEQVYLAARLAIARLLAQDQRPPLILDDPFLAYDDQRTAAVLALCRRLSLEHQILLFTCREGYQSSADQTIRLPAL